MSPRDIYQAPEGGKEFVRTGKLPEGEETPEAAARPAEEETQEEPEAADVARESEPESESEAPADPLEALPEELREVVSELPEGRARDTFLDQHRQLVESRQSHAERRRELRDLQRRERDLLESRASWAESVLERFGQQGSPQTPVSGAVAEQAQLKGIPVTFNEATGAYEMPPEAVQQVIEQHVRGALGQQQQAHSEQSRRVGLTQSLIQRANLAEGDQEKIAKAWRFLAERADQVFHAYGRPAQNLSEIQEAYARSGLAEDLKEVAPGIAMEDVLELDFLATAPENSGSRIPEILSRYRSASANGTPEPERVVPSEAKPRPLSQRATRRTERKPSKGVERISKMGPDELLALSPDELLEIKKEIGKDLGIRL